MQEIPAQWLSELDEVLARLDQEPDTTPDAGAIARLTALDPDLLTFLVSHFAEQDSPQAADTLEALALHPQTPEPVREHARSGLRALEERGIMPGASGTERFVAGWVQQGRERGEQILMLCWRMAPEDFEAMVFLLDWRGDGLKDFYRTRRMKDPEWQHLVEHNRSKGVPLVEIDLEQARALLAASLAESRRFSRSLPRDYKIETSIIERRLDTSREPAITPPDFISTALSPEEVVAAYVSALHYRDYLLVAMLQDDTNALRAGRTREETAEELRKHFKHAPRRERDVSVSRIEPTDDEADEAVVEANGAQVTVEKTGRRLRQPVHERYVLKRNGTWRVVSVS